MAYRLLVITVFALIQYHPLDTRNVIDTVKPGVGNAGNRIRSWQWWHDHRSKDPGGSGSGTGQPLPSYRYRVFDLEPEPIETGFRVSSGRSGRQQEKTLVQTLKKDLRELKEDLDLFYQNDQADSVGCVAGQWGAWERWGPCSVTCGTATRRRTRDCQVTGQGHQRDKKKEEDCSQLPASSSPSSSPSSSSSRKCLGVDFQEKRCKGLPPCPSTSYWGEWGQCSVTCKGQSGLRERVLVTKTVSGDVTISDKDGQLEACEGPTQCSGWGEWSPCVIPCNVTSGTRHRIYIQQSPDGTVLVSPDKVDQERCEGTPGPCQASATDTNLTSPQPTVLKCARVLWSPWQEWSACNVTCGQGRMTRTRQCLNPDPKLCPLNNCLGHETESAPCNSDTVSCCVPREWTLWGSWGPCSSKCSDYQGTRNRQRSCEFFGGPSHKVCDLPVNLTCPGQDRQVEQCHELPACTPGQEWSAWTECSARCSDEAGVRGRVLVVRQRYGFTHADGAVTQKETCKVDGPPCAGTNASTSVWTKEKECINGGWTKYGPYSACSVTCGSGVRRRSRTCINPPPNACGQTCQGFQHIDEPCVVKADCGTCAQRAWMPWNAWGACSASCGVALRSRSRSCDFVGPMEGKDCGLDSSKQCHGSQIQEETCEESPACPVVNVTSASADKLSVQCKSVQWSAWGSWSYCSQTCGEGIKGRRRLCQNNSVQWCRANCREMTTEQRVCSEGPCTLECAQRSWDAWGPWGACDSTCGSSAFRTRTQTCEFKQRDLEGKRDCGVDSYENCMGDDLQEEMCTGLPPCVSLSYWASWNECSVSCRGEIGFRERMTYTEQTSGYISLTPALNHIQACVGDKVDCGVWTTWGNWSSCSCKTGKRVRDRKCVPKEGSKELDPDPGVKLTCEGDAQETSSCNTTGLCPECITSCGNRTSGLYPSCNSCSEYIRCGALPAEHRLERCQGEKREWNALTNSCVASPSPTCSLQDCLTSCQGKSGVFQVCYDCRKFASCNQGRVRTHTCLGAMELDFRSKACSYHRSQTCKRKVTSVQRGASFDATDEGETTRSGTGKNKKKEGKKKKGDKRKNKKDRKKKKKNKKDRKKKKKDRRRKRKDKRKKRKNRVAKVKVVVPDCVTGCDGLAKGSYPSCRSCRHYWKCAPKRHRSKERRCAKNRSWDNTLHKCLPVSATCPGNSA